MRFAYIDSQGNEVPIPSIDALALRIELGAVGPETQLYDAQADHWGPAHTHEIFHSLSRDAEGDGFIAPPPVAPAPAAPTPAAEETEPESAAPEPEPEDEPEPEEDGEVDLGLTLADPLPEPPEDEGAEDDVGGDFALDTSDPSETPLIAEAPPLADEAPSLADGSGALEVEEPADDAGGFDFGDLGSGLELEDASQSGDMGLETEMEFQAPQGDFGGGDDDSLELEQPMSSFEPDEPPGWMEEPDTDDVMDFSAVSEEEAAVENVASVADAPARQRRTPKDRPSPPKFKKQRSMSGPIVLVVLLLLIGVGGYYAWPVVQARMAARDVPEQPAVVLPSIPEELIPQMRSLGEAAIAAVVASADASSRPAGAPAGPDDDWLGGVYLGNASQYPGIEEFWSGVEGFTQALRASEWQAYHDRYVEGVAQAGLAADVAAQITERADSGFVAARPQREVAYAELERLAYAALELHDFLLDNEADIVFRPGATSATDPTVDPVLEIAAPADDRERMLSFFDEITDALDALGSLDRVTRERLVAAMTSRLQEVGLQ